jgi:hypothetical protein
MKPIHYIIALIFIAGMANGVMDKLQFHYGKSVFAKFENQDFWNPNRSWRNKWAQDDEGNLVQPLTPRYWGSSTFLVWTTDAWHLAQTIFFAAWRTALVLVASIVWRFSPRNWLNTAIWIVLWLVLAGVQAGGFHLLYTYLLNA